MSGNIKVNINQVKKPFIPLAYRSKPVRKAKVLDPIMVCKKNKKSLNKFGIFKDQEVRFEVKRINSISFYDGKAKQMRYVSLSPKQMKCFREVK
jgi:hypothetical protein